ncbi:putative 7-carboxy-7-deazaguanine synthase QueE [Cellulosilyticum ruminicola]|uniref:putative 7-carboxy-7-deazaguanine synthase QueE n=1 Tax=Cellulosilyticum ruminicola TaxID=425254 RepID=UPI0006D2C2A8|nr:putative 7-carboxy-7-deazaguanine synthase QueE [Cellulosilyticum ruminicola]
MKTYSIIEKFVSIDGEGPTAGALSVFIRFEGCNLRCKWCDTTYSFDGSSLVETLTAQEIMDYILATGVKHVTLTGGEPLWQKDIEGVLDLLATQSELTVHIETNGAVDISPFKTRYEGKKIYFILDYKLHTSGMMHKMLPQNLVAVTAQDVYKLVVGSKEDLETAYEIIMQNDLVKRCQVYLSPVKENIDPAFMVEFMKEKNLDDVKLQLQLHKIIWPKESRGV